MGEPSLAYRVREAASAIRGVQPTPPRVAMILGTGLGPLAEQIADPAIIPYSDIPHFPRSTVPGHSGQLFLGSLEGVPVAVMRGRVHYYEGYGLREVTFPVRVLRRLGAETLIVTNAAGGLNEHFRRGDLMVLSDHINLMGLTGHNPLVGPDEPELGVRFLDVTVPYDPALRGMAIELARAAAVPAHEGVYAVVSGPSFETRAETRFLRATGADAVGMSTAHEVIAARHEGMRVLGISVITNTAADAEQGSELSHEDVLSVAGRAAGGLELVIRGILRSLSAPG
jgi:purine-nucleoside phosphorylase